MPCVLSLNCGNDNPQDVAFWQAQHELLYLDNQKIYLPVQKVILFPDHLTFIKTMSIDLFHLHWQGLDTLS